MILLIGLCPQPDPEHLERRLRVIHTLWNEAPTSRQQRTEFLPANRAPSSAVRIANIRGRRGGHPIREVAPGAEIFVSSTKPPVGDAES
jgi:hypothetical protein